MITSLLELATTNSGGVKTASVMATEGGEGSTEVFNFTIINQNISKTEVFGPRETKVVTVVHTASGQGLVLVTNQSSGLTRHCWLDVDAPRCAC